IGELISGCAFRLRRRVGAMIQKTWRALQPRQLEATNSREAALIPGGDVETKRNRSRRNHYVAFPYHRAAANEIGPDLCVDPNHAQIERNNAVSIKDTFHEFGSQLALFGRACP